MYSTSGSVPTNTLKYVKYTAMMTYWYRSTVHILLQFKPPTCNTSLEQALTLIFARVQSISLCTWSLTSKIYAQLIVVSHFLLIHVHCTFHTHAYKRWSSSVQEYTKGRVHAYTKWPTVCIAFQCGSVGSLQQSGFREYFDLHCLLSTWQHFQDEQMLQRWDVT